MELIYKYFPDLVAEKYDRLERMGTLYRNWNEKVNLISRRDMDNLYERHILHSLSVAKIIQFRPGTSIMDAGTGGGFPGLPLSVLFPESNFTLVDSTAKKLKVVDSIAYELGLDNVNTRHVRLEVFADRFEFVISRAVSDLNQMAGWVMKNIVPGGSNELANGLLYLKGGDFRGELQAIRRPFRIYDIADHFSEDFFITKKIVFIPA